ncbi:hypothetical protein [Leifsonia poae]|uniref:Uncharacterized protein n=1 Tax=Leifsonia poae TaxID=110933 RepID=A0A9W6LYM3_9MICO|nr:hypothetical protein [Leifsonia poae]GLJ74747.1 hypothetical protein GCM10017584_03200 [Leifsonia poae]
MAAVVYSADVDDLRVAIERTQERIAGLAEPRLYATAFALAVLVRTNKVTAWRSWDSPPPRRALDFGRRELQWAMQQLFGTEPHALLHGGSSASLLLTPGCRVMLDPFYGSASELTLVSDKRIPGAGTRNTLRMDINDASWLWSHHDGVHAIRTVEYNAGNTLNQQNGLGCRLPASEVTAETSYPETEYMISRIDCVHRKVGTGDPTCALNGQVCGGLGAGGGRNRTKPRLLIPPTPSQETRMLVPGGLEILLDKSTEGGSRKRPIAADLSLLVAWCASDGIGPFDFTRLVGLLGAPGLSLLTDKD